MPDRYKIGVRPATAADIEAMSVVLIASITQLCAADHHNDPAHIAQWTRNKSPDGIRAMLANPDLTLLVAERSGEIAGVAGYQGDTVALNYVSPDHRFAGVSKALMASAEAGLKARDHRVAKLYSSATAFRFYLAIGWIDDSQPGVDYAASGRPMHKVLG